MEPLIVIYQRCFDRLSAKNQSRLINEQPRLFFLSLVFMLLLALILCVSMYYAVLSLSEDLGGTLSFLVVLASISFVLGVMLSSVSNFLYHAPYPEIDQDMTDA